MSGSVLGLGDTKVNHIVPSLRYQYNAEIVTYIDNYKTLNYN